MTLHLLVAARSEVGLVRKNNQDSGYASQHLLVVADGMGGAAAGDLASAVAIDEIMRLDTAELLTDAGLSGDHAAPTEGAGDGDGDEQTVIVSPAADVPVPPEQGPAGRNPMLARFGAAISEANSRIADLVAADHTLEGMGTTVTGAIFDGRRLGLAHIGDSRAYLLRDGRLEQLTHDHSWVQSLVDDGKITQAEAAYHPHRSLLLKVLNGQPANDPDLTSIELKEGDRLLFCSDGLCGMVDDDEIAELAAASDLEAAVVGLVDAALGAGGIDNITVILAEVLAGPDAPAAASPGPSTAGSTAGSGDDEDTAVRRVVAIAAVLGAAADREIPSVPRRRPLVPGFADDDLEDGDHDLGDGDEDDGPSAGASPPPPPHQGAATTADDESRYAPRPPAQRRIIRTLLVGLVILLIAGAGLGAGYAWTRTQYFVGAAGDQVAIYQGLPDGIPGLPLSQVYEVQDLPVADLPPYYQAQVVAGIEVSGLDAARLTVAQLKETAVRCAQPTPTPKPTPTPAGPTAGPTVSATPRPTVSDSAGPSPTPSGTPGPGQGC